jgi:hypothetical protein
MGSNDHRRLRLNRLCRGTGRKHKPDNEQRIAQDRLKG